jgi:hypothetical protein
MSTGIDQRQALRLLAGSPYGCTVANMLALGFTNATLNGLVRDGQVTIQPGTVRNGTRRIADHHHSSARGCSRRRPSYSKSQNPLQQVRIGEAVVPRRRRKFLALRDLRIGICFEEIENTFSGQAKIDAGIAIELQRPVDPLRCSLDAGV